MTNDNTLFTPATGETSEAAMVAAALRCVEAFTERFNARDTAGMDALLHFPHAILSGERLVLWPEPGQLPARFFEDLTAATGWHRSRYLRKRAVLVSPRKVHLLVSYTRERADGSVASIHHNLWVVTEEEGRWGIKQRSY